MSAVVIGCRTSRWRCPRSGVATVAALAALAVLGAACGTGSATIRIDEGEDIVDGTVRGIAEALDLEVVNEVELGARRSCDLPGARQGASNTVALRGPVPDVDDPLGIGASVMVDNGFELVDGGGPDIIFGRRAGMRITVDQGGNQIAIDGSTGCRPVQDS